MNWKNLNWENLCDDLIERLPEKLGAYAIRWAPKGKPQPIQRIFGADDSGILCFGMTGRRTLRQRLGEFYGAAGGGNQPHIEGGRYHEIGYANYFPLQELQIGCRVCNDEMETKNTEIVWFNEYERFYGELPPLNYKKG
jgi:hypothetical protein